MSFKTFLKGRARRAKIDPLVPSYIGVYFCPVDDSLCQAVASQGTALDASTAVAGFGWDGSSQGEVGGVILGAPSFGQEYRCICIFQLIILDTWEGGSTYKTVHSFQ